LISPTFKSSQGAPNKDKNGRVLIKQDEQNERWVEHFSEILNQTVSTEVYSDNDLQSTEDIISE
jgi:hypothetical protein